RSAVACRVRTRTCGFSLRSLRRSSRCLTVITRLAFRERELHQAEARRANHRDPQQHGSSAVGGGMVVPLLAKMVHPRRTEVPAMIFATVMKNALYSARHGSADGSAFSQKIRCLALRVPCSVMSGNFAASH